MVENEKIRTVKPKLKFLIVALPSILHSFFGGVVLSLVLYVFIAYTGFGLFLISGNISDKYESILRIVGISMFTTIISSWFIVWLFIVLLKYAQAKRTEYNFFNDRIEYSEGLLVVVKKIIYYRRITNLTLVKGVLEKRYNLGSIYVDTAGTLGHEMNIWSIENPERIYNFLSKIIRIPNGST